MAPPPRSGGASPAAEPPSISGTVTDAAHAGLMGVKVTVTSMSTYASVNATTVGDGTYSVTGLPAGYYQVCFDASGATGGSSKTGYVAQCYNNQTTPWQADPVTVTVGATRTGIDAALAVGGASSGTVTDAAHAGLMGVKVTVTSMSTYASANATTARDGTYLVTGLPDGKDYSVCFDASGATGGSSSTGYLSQCYDGLSINAWPTKSVVVTVGATRTGIDAALAVAGAISGKVTKAGDSLHELANVTVQVTSSSPDFPRGNVRATTDAHGNYTMTGLPAATDYQVWFYASYGADGTGYVPQSYDHLSMAVYPTTPVGVTLGKTTTKIDAALTAYGAISGVVTDANGVGLENVQVYAYSVFTGGAGGAFTDANGRFTAPGMLAADDYHVLFTTSDIKNGPSKTGYVTQYYANPPSPGTLTPVAVTWGVIKPIGNTALAVGGAVSGKVTDAAGKGLANVLVVVNSLTQHGTGDAVLYGTGEAKTAADGTYTVTGLVTADDYKVYFNGDNATGGSSDATGYAGQWYKDQTSWSKRDSVIVTGGQTTPKIDATLVGKP
ncbi:MAG: carboxypeptidase regulatory-like domain-containing protein [Dermatophilaceae bacterium]